MVLPDGELLEVTEDSSLSCMQKLRSSYGTFGIVYEVTYQIRKLLPMARVTTRLTARGVSGEARRN